MNDTSDKYANFSHDELVAEINRLKKHKKYGLVWEHKTEKVIEDFETQQPYLEEVTDKRIEDAPDEPTNLIIEGDNFEALSILNYTHAGKVDVIYIDPPYNTGNKDFIYNDDYVDSEDEFRHSKWLSFMEPRLKLAKNLLKDDGFLLISIDENEQAALKAVCDDIFGNKAFIASLIWQNKYTISNDKGNGLSTQTEYILCYSKVDASLVAMKPAPLRDEYIKANYKNPDNDPNGPWMSVQMFKYKNPYSFEVVSPTGKKWNMPWNFTVDSFKKLADEGKIYWGEDGNSCPRKKVYLKDSKGTSHKNLLLGSEVGYAANSSAELKNVFNKANVFPYPKPSSSIKHIINYSNNPSATVLDFFAGSGTTGQAVLELNKEDGGHRQFILCTNNGDKGPDSTKIAEEITYPRIKTVITGVRQDGSKYSDGIPANLRYYKISHREKKPSIDANRQDMAAYMEDIIQVKENAYKQLEVNEDFAIYESNEKYVGLVFEPFSLEEAIANLKERNTEKRPAKLYVFSYSRDAFEDDYGADFEIEFVAMPEGLLKTYAHIVEEQKKEDL